MRASYPVLDLDEYRRQARDGQAPAEARLHLDVPSEAKALAGDRQIRFRITTSAVDRMKDTIDPQGWDLKNYKRNPTVLWAHQHAAPPIGKATAIHADDRGLVADVTFATKEQYAFADTIYQLVLGGFLNATSVGFKPIKHVYNEQRGGVDFLEQELLEISVVPVPANAEALVQGRSIDLRPLRDWLGRQRTRKDATDCPAGRDCVNPMSAESCPAGRLCPMSGAGRTSWGGGRADEPILILADDGPDEYVLEISDDKTVHVDLGDLARAFVDVVDAEVRSVLGRAKGDPDYSPSRIVPRGGRRI